MKQRILRLEELILRELGLIIQKEFERPLKDFISITRVHLGKDLTQATIYVSVFPEKDQEKILKNLNKSSGFLALFLHKRLKAYNLPKLYFKYDPSIARDSRIEQLIEQIKKSE
jgi:ribosome-binding factor A